MSTFVGKLATTPLMDNQFVEMIIIIIVTQSESEMQKGFLGLRLRDNEVTFVANDVQVYRSLIGFG